MKTPVVSNMANRSIANFVRMSCGALLIVLVLESVLQATISSHQRREVSIRFSAPRKSGLEIRPPLESKVATTTPRSNLEDGESSYRTPFHYYFARYKNYSIPLAHKWEPYFVAYHTHFARFRNQPVNFMEVGVQSGGSALMWKWYFGDQMNYYGIDIDPKTRRFGNSNWTHITIGDASSSTFWKQVRKTLPAPDIFLDDGGHRPHQQHMAYEQTFDWVKDGGIWSCEDLSSSYYRPTGGSSYLWERKENQVFMETAKSFVDQLHGDRMSREAREPFRKFTHSVESIHFYESIVLVEKRSHGWVRQVKAGTKQIAYPDVPMYSVLNQSAVQAGAAEQNDTSLYEDMDADLQLLKDAA